MKRWIALLLTVALCLSLVACVRSPAQPTQPGATTEPVTQPSEPTTEPVTQPTELREPVAELQSVHPAILGGLIASSGSRVAVSWMDPDLQYTTVQLVDVNKDEVCGEIRLDGLWTLKDQTFADGRVVLYQRETNTWKFLSGSMEELGTWTAESVDGYFSYDGDTYYYVSDRVLWWQRVSDNQQGMVQLPLNLRLLDISAFDGKNQRMAMQFYLSPYSSRCGTAIWDMAAGKIVMLREDRGQVFFRQDSPCLMAFDLDKMGYCLTYQSGGQDLYADAAIFGDTAVNMYAVSSSPYLIGIAEGGSILYCAQQKVTACQLSAWGIHGEMYSSCYLAEEEVVVGAVYGGGAFHFYVLDPAQLDFAEVDSPQEAEPMLTVDETLVSAYWNGVSGMPVTETLQDARDYADQLEETYGIRILLSSQCKEAAALCDLVMNLSDNMDPDAELKGIRAMLEALSRSLAVYPEGFLGQFRNAVGDGGLCFLLVENIETGYGAVGCTYERFEWQYIALAVEGNYNRDPVIFHELWHATENHAFSQDYLAIPADEWDALNPADFTYGEDYMAQDPTQPGLLYNSSPEEIHFVDAYACVKRQEDRARLMEYFMAYEEEAQILIQSPFIRQKLQMMCDAVRRTFDTTGWENVRWERLLK